VEPRSEVRILSDALGDAPATAGFVVFGGEREAGPPPRSEVRALGSRESRLLDPVSADEVTAHFESAR
jgi:hypothetical protein